MNLIKIERRYISVMAAACSRHSAGEAGDINLERSDSVRCGMIMAVARSRGTRAEISAISQQYILSYKKPAPSHLSSIHNMMTLSVPMTCRAVCIVIYVPHQRENISRGVCKINRSKRTIIEIFPSFRMIWNTGEYVLKSDTY